MPETMDLNNLPNSTQASVWLIEDNIAYRESLARAVNSIESSECCGQYDSVEHAIESADESNLPNVVLLDVDLPGINGIDGIALIRERVPDARIIMLTVFDDSDKIFRAICAEASGYLLKSGDLESLQQAIHDVLNGGAPMTPSVARRVLELFNRNIGKRPTEDYCLTQRETEVLERMVDGLTKKEIAARLQISAHTVHTHLRNVYDKLHVHTRSEAVAKAIREGLV